MNNVTSLKYNSTSCSQEDKLTKQQDKPTDRKIVETWSKKKKKEVLVFSKLDFDKKIDRERLKKIDENHERWNLNKENTQNHAQSVLIVSPSFLKEQKVRERLALVAAKREENRKKFDAMRRAASAWKATQEQVDQTDKNMESLLKEEAAETKKTKRRRNRRQKQAPQTTPVVIPVVIKEEKLIKAPPAEKKVDINYALLLHQQESEYTEMNRIKRWQTTNQKEIRDFIDFSHSRKLQHNYKSLAEDELAQQRKYHYLPKTELIISNTATKERWSFKTERGYGIFTEIIDVASETSECGITYFGINEQRIIYHKKFEPMQNLSNEEKAWLKNTIPSFEAKMEIKEKEDWVYTISYEFSMDTNTLILKYPNENYYLKFYPV